MSHHLPKNADLGPPPLRAGDPLLPGYHVRDHLGRGQEADVYDVWSDRLGCYCVAKVLRDGIEQQDAWHQTLRNEGSLMAMLAHPNIVRIFEVVEGPPLTLVIELLPGMPLTTLIHEDVSRYFPWPDIVTMGTQLCSALAFLHARGYAHLDLKPPNIFVDGGRYQLIDFGLSRPFGYARQGIGSARYMAPEQAFGDPTGPATDMWALGVIMFEAASKGQWPFKPTHDPYPQVGAEPYPVGRFRRLPPPLERFISSCLSQDPADRPSPGDFATAFYD